MTQFFATLICALLLAGCQTREIKVTQAARMSLAVVAPVKKWRLDWTYSQEVVMQRVFSTSDLALPLDRWTLEARLGPVERSLPITAFEPWKFYTVVGYVII